MTLEIISSIVNIYKEKNETTINNFYNGDMDRFYGQYYEVILGVVFGAMILFYIPVMIREYKNYGT